jgi:ABC-2 type transport system permease protein/oleandomycin transport system permease protein
LAATFFTIAQRDIIALVRIPTSLVFAIIQPIMFVLLFRYVFGGAISAPGQSYVDFLIPGILVQTTIFGAVGTAIGLAEDLQKGLIERFRALPMSRLAVLGGRTIADTLRNILVLIVITIVGVAVGFRPSGGILPYLQASLLMLSFAFALSWGFTWIGLKAPELETAQAMTFPLIFPLTFASTIFVPVQTMPSWLRAFATNQPVSQVATAVRGLMTSLPHGNSTYVSIAWTVGALLVLVPLATRAYRRVAVGRDPLRAARRCSAPGASR